MFPKRKSTIRGRGIRSYVGKKKSLTQGPSAFQATTLQLSVLLKHRFLVGRCRAVPESLPCCKVPGDAGNDP